MKADILAAALIAVGLIIAGFALGGRYQIVPVDEYTTHRIDRWTGAVALCGRWEGNGVACVNAPELYHDGKTPVFAKPK